MKSVVSLNENMPMRVRLDVDGKEVYSGRAKSFLRNFLLFFHSFANGDHIQEDINVLKVSTSPTQPFDNGLFLVTTVAISSGKLRLTTSGTHGLTTGEYAYIMGVNTITGGTYLGYQEITFVSGTIIELTNTSGLSGTHDASISVAYIRRADRTDRLADAVRSDATTFGESRIALGRGTTANSVTTDSMADEIVTGSGLSGRGTFAASTLSPVIGEPTVGATASTIELEQVFVNNSGASQNINEIGLWTHVESNSTASSYFALIIRDVLGSTVTVNNGQTLTVTYEIVTDVPTTDGGMLIQFNEILYRQLAAVSRESKDIFNANAVRANTAGQFYMNSKGGLNPLSDDPLTATSLSSYYIGPRIGSSTENVVNTNFRLQDAIGSNTAFEHGDDTNEFYHYGSYITPIEVDGDDLYFQVWRIFENRTVSTITVNEVGLYTGYLSSDNILDVHCIARHKITPVNVLLGEYIKVVYEIRITV
jgi:hypothetical protein